MDIELENGAKVTLRKPKVRDRAVRSRIYGALENGNTEWEYAETCIYIEKIEGIKWKPPSKDATGLEIQENFETWIDLPVEIGDWISSAIYVMKTEALNPKKAD